MVLLHVNVNSPFKSEASGKWPSDPSVELQQASAVLLRPCLPTLSSSQLFCKLSSTELFSTHHAWHHAFTAPSSIACIFAPVLLMHV
eukprot:scaffold210051_cov19-Tisochrysis_lutea.AAC.3